MTSRQVLVLAMTAQGARSHRGGLREWRGGLREWRGGLREWRGGHSLRWVERQRILRGNRALWHDPRSLLVLDDPPRSLRVCEGPPGSLRLHVLGRAVWPGLWAVCIGLWLVRLLQAPENLITPWLGYSTPR